MADEISMSGNVRMTKGSLSIQRQSGTLQIDMAGSAFSWNVQAIGTSEEALAINADVATYGVAYFTNTDATNYVEIGVVPVATFVPVLRLNAGEFAMVRLSPAVALYAKANTAPVKLEHLIIEV